jgi:hypothetical protein
MLPRPTVTETLGELVWPKVATITVGNDGPNAGAMLIVPFSMESAIGAGPLQFGTGLGLIGAGTLQFGTSLGLIGAGTLLFGISFGLIGAGPLPFGTLVGGDLVGLLPQTA